MINVTLRLSTNKDVKMELPISITISEIRECLLKEEPSLQGKNVRFFYMGKPLDLNQTIVKYANNVSLIIQVMVS